jgi:hypothetical protein
VGTWAGDLANKLKLAWQPPIIEGPNTEGFLMHSGIFLNARSYHASCWWTALKQNIGIWLSGLWQLGVFELNSRGAIVEWGILKEEALMDATPPKPNARVWLHLTLHIIFQWKAQAIIYEGGKW